MDDDFPDTEILDAMHRCDSCGHIFDDPEVWDEAEVMAQLTDSGWEAEHPDDHEFLQHHMSVEADVDRCPECKSTDVHLMSEEEHREFHGHY